MMRYATAPRVAEASLTPSDGPALAGAPSASLATLTHFLSGALAGVALLTSASAVQAQAGAEACGNPFVNHFGPFDFRTAPASERKLVEDFHFTPGIEALIRPRNTTFREMAQDVGYTLNVFPNHPRALIAMTRLAERWKSDPPPGTTRPVECWFDRAIRFRPDDTVVRSLFAQWLHKVGRTDEASVQLKTATSHAGDNALSHYNIGLVLFEIGRYDLALQQAHKASALGFPRTELASQLKQVGHWREPASD